VKVFVDTNVLLDVLAERKPFYRDSMRIWTMAETGRLDALVSVMSYANCYYIVRRFAGRSNAERALRLMRDIFTPVDLTGRIMNQAMDAGFDDFEDAIQWHSALHARASCIITRNAGDFPHSPLPALSPAEFLAAHP
jgi:predicted nucleic acid-binding protein